MPAYCGNDCTSDCGHCKGRNLRPEVWAMINEAWGGHVASTVKALVGRYERATTESDRLRKLGAINNPEADTTSGRAIGYAQAVGLLIGRSMGQVMVDINKGDL
jgi:hypothetical protein